MISDIEQRIADLRVDLKAERNHKEKNEIQKLIDSNVNMLTALDNDIDLGAVYQGETIVVFNKDRLTQFVNECLIDYHDFKDSNYRAQITKRIEDLF